MEKEKKEKKEKKEEKEKKEKKEKDEKKEKKKEKKALWTMCCPLSITGKERRRRRNGSLVIHWRRHNSEPIWWS